MLVSNENILLLCSAILMKNRSANTSILEGLYGGKMSFFKYNIYYLYFSSFILKKEHAVFY